MTKKASLTFEEAKHLQMSVEITQSLGRIPLYNRLVREHTWSDELFPQRKKHHYWTLKIQKVASRYGIICPTKSIRAYL